MNWTREEGGVDVIYRVKASVGEYDPGIVTGPPDRCYQPEGGDVEDVTLVRLDGGTMDGSDTLDYDSLPEEERQALDEELFRRHMENMEGGDDDPREDD